MHECNLSLGYIKRKQNIVAGALSRRYSQLQHVSADVAKKLLSAPAISAKKNKHYGT